MFIQHISVAYVHLEELKKIQRRLRSCCNESRMASVVTRVAWPLSLPRFFAVVSAARQIRVTTRSQLIAKQHRQDVTEDPKSELRAHLRLRRQRLVARVIHVSVFQGRPLH